MTKGLMEVKLCNSNSKQDGEIFSYIICQMRAGSNEDVNIRIHARNKEVNNEELLIIRPTDNQRVN